MKTGFFFLVFGLGLGFWLSQSREHRPASPSQSTLYHESLPHGMITHTGLIPTFYPVPDSTEKISPPPALPDPIDDTLLSTIIAVESSGNPRALGPFGERGLMQLRAGAWHEATTHLYGKPLPYKKAWDANTNRQAGEAYLRIQLARLEAHRDEWKSPLIQLLMASYNAGASGVARHDFDIKAMPKSVQAYVSRASKLYREARIQEAVARRHMAMTE